MRFKRGDQREDGKVFLRYYRARNGDEVEQWGTLAQRENQLSYKRDPEKNREHCKAWKAKNRDKQAGYTAEWGRRNPEQVLAIARRSQRKRRRENPNAVRAVAKEWRLKNRDKIKAYRDQWRADPVKRMAHRCRDRIRSVIRYHGLKKAGTLEYLGCSWEALREHLESQFQEGMSWKNFGQFGWHVDHRIPLASAATLEELVPLLHFSNLQPLWWHQNLSKGARE